jgi:hypothetical protein
MVVEVEALHLIHERLATGYWMGWVHDIFFVAKPPSASSLNDHH